MRRLAPSHIAMVYNNMNRTMVVKKEKEKKDSKTEAIKQK
jgi:hypothetical protein